MGEIMQEKEKDQNKMKLIFGILITAILLLLIISVLFSALGIGTNYSETFIVTDPSLDQYNNLTRTPSNGVTVYQDYGNGWEVISNSYVTVIGKEVIVADDPLYG